MGRDGLHIFAQPTFTRSLKGAPFWGEPIYSLRNFLSALGAITPAALRADANCWPKRVINEKAIKRTSFQNFAQLGENEGTIFGMIQTAGTITTVRKRL